MTQSGRTSVMLSVVAMGSAVIGWLAFAGAIVLGDHFNRADPRSGLLLLLWLLLGLVASAAWIGAIVTALRGRRDNAPEAGRATLLAVLTPCTWAMEFGVLIIWFGYEALSGPWPH